MNSKLLLTKSFFIFLIAAAAFTSCKKTKTEPTSETTAETTPITAVVDTTNTTWASYSHGDNQAALYDTIFPQDKVNQLEITMTAQQWTSIQTNMKSIYGNAFGTAGKSSGGGDLDGYADPDYIPVTVKFNGKKWNFAGFRLKGNSSLSSAWSAGNYKLPFRLNMDTFEDEHTSIKNQRFYGFKELSMSPAFKDNSLIREKVTADIFRMAGIPAAQTAFYKVYIDFGTGLKYCGVYTMCEVIDDTMVKKQFGEDKGNIYKPLSTFVTYAQADFEKKNNKSAANYTDVQTFLTALNSSLRTTNPSQWRSNLDASFNTSHFIKWLAVNTAIVNWDSYGTKAHNYYLYNSPTQKITWIPWDHNEAMRTTGTGGGNSGLSLSLAEVSGSNWPLIRYIADDAVYFALYKQYMKEFKNNTFTTTNMNALFDKYHSLISPYVIGTNGEKTGYTYLANSSDFTNELSVLKAHVATRITAITTFAP
jgi:spore coat protein H